MREFGYVVSYVLDQPWAILPERLTAVCGVIARWAAGERLSEEEIQARIGSNARPPTPVGRHGAIAVIPVWGVVAHRAHQVQRVSGPGGVSTELLTKAVNAAVADSDIRAVVLDIDSPGGGVYGLQELHHAIMSARGIKRVVAVVNAQAASAAYWIASGAEEVVIAPGGQVGSIGVFLAHQDLSEALAKAGVKTTLISAGKFKAEGNPFQPLTEEAISAAQGRVDDFYEQFVGAVAAGRGVTKAQVKSGFGQGRLVGAADAVASGMVDRIETLDDVLGRLSGRSRNRGVGPERAEEDGAVEPVAGEFDPAPEATGAASVSEVPASGVPADPPAAEGDGIAAAVEQEQLRRRLELLEVE